MKKVLYVNGCSHSCGAELEYVGSCRTPYDFTNGWGGIIANKYNLIHYNDARPGAGNKEIHSTLIYSLLKLLEEYKPSEIFVIVGWTSFERTEIIYENTNYTFAGGLNENQAPWIKNWPSVVQDAYKSWVMTTDFDHSINTFSMYYFATINFLNLNKIPYFFFNAINPIHSPSRNFLNCSTGDDWNKRLFYLMENDPNYLEPHNPEMTYLNYLKKKYDPQIEGRNFHFREDAQQEWANLLIPHVDKQLSN